MRDILQEIWSTAKRNKLRTSLTGFAVAWGIFMLICLLGAGNGVINASMTNQNRWMVNSMKVGAWMTSKPYKGYKEGRVIQLDDNDVAQTQTLFDKNIEDVGVSMFAAQLPISLNDNSITVGVEGVSAVNGKIDKVKILRGRYVNDKDEQERRKSIVIPEGIAKVLNEHDPLSIMGQTVRLGGFAFRVIGISQDDMARNNNSVYIPFTTARVLYQKGNKVESILFSFKKLDSEAANKTFEAQYRARINNNHQAAPDDEQALWIWNRFTQNLQQQTALSITRTALWIVGLFTLLSGIVGVSNIMLITVKERTREIGIRKAIGATPWSILKLIIIESIIITTFFGYLGMVAGIAANLYMDATIGNQTINSGIFEFKIFDNPIVGFDVCIEATLLMIVAGTLAGLIPARKAAHIRPIQALMANP